MREREEGLEGLNDLNLGLVECKVVNLLWRRIIYRHYYSHTHIVACIATLLMWLEVMKCGEFCVCVCV